MHPCVSLGVIANNLTNIATVFSRRTLEQSCGRPAGTTRGIARRSAVTEPRGGRVISSAEVDCGLIGPDEGSGSRVVIGQNPVYGKQSGTSLVNERGRTQVSALSRCWAVGPTHRYRAR
jgi:hypothetical protein